MTYYRRIVGILLSALLIFSSFIPIGNVRAMDLPETEFGKILDRRQMELAPNAVYNWYNMEIDRGLQKIHFVEFDPRAEHLELQAGTKSGYVYGMQRVTDMAGYVDGPGNRVIAGINGDFYDLSGQGTGVPNGLFMGDGIILNSSAGPYAFGLKADGSSIYGPTPELKRTLAIGETEIPITHINRYRGDNQLVLYTTDYYSSTASTSAGDEVIVDILEGTVSSGQTLQMRVKEVRTNQGDSPLEPGTAVLSASGSMRTVLAGLEPGDLLSAYFELDEAWQDVKVAIGGRGPLVQDGVPLDVPPAGVHPRTAIGTKADGSIILFEIDGRAPGFSEGVENLEMAQILVDLGVVNAMNLDGGGSSTFVARLPGESAIQMLNRGSDGFERSTGNSLLLVNRAPAGDASKLVVQPNFERVLAGSSFQLQAAAVDATGHPAALQGTLAWSVEESLGTVTPDGRFTAADGAAAGIVTVEANGLKGQGEIEVVKEITDLVLPDAVKTMPSGSVEALTVTALRNGQVVQAENNRFQWRVDGPIGTIDEDGVFTATEENNQSGTIYVTYGEVETSMEVHVGVPPVILENFENGLGNYRADSVAANRVAISEETNPDFVRSGSSSLKLEYDFIGRTGTSGAYLAATGTNTRIQVPGYPEKISMWVYGDGSGQWLRGQMRDGDGAAFPIDFTSENPGVDWVGWKYVEAVVPAGKSVPLTMDLPIRFMATKNDNKTAGVLYFDDIRAIYGPLENEDRTPPILRNLTPGENQIVFTDKPAIQAIAEDDGYDPVEHPGTTLIDPASIRLYLNNVKVNHTLYPPEGRISYTPALPLDEGVHRVKLAVRDLAGNQTIKEWNFFVNLGSPMYVYETPEELLAGHTYTLDVKAENTEHFSGGHLEFVLDTGKIDYIEAVPGSKLTAANLQTGFNEQTGVIRLQFSGLDSLQLTDKDVLAQIQYRVKPAAEGNMSFDFSSGSVEIAGEAPKPFIGLSLEASIAHSLQLSWEEEGSGQGLTTEFSVVDAGGQPVEGAGLLVNGNLLRDADNELRTDAAGILQTDALTAELETYDIQAVKGDDYSPVYSFAVSPLFGTEAPYNVSIAMSSRPAHDRGFTWHTHPDVSETVVEVIPRAEWSGQWDDAPVQRFTGNNYLYYTDHLGVFRVHKASAVQLETDTEYVYRVGDGKGRYSSEGSFKTAASSGDDVKFLFFGDSQAANDAGFELWGNTLRSALDTMPDPDFIMHAGDMVDHGHDQRQWNMWFKAAQEALMNHTLVTVVGNHEVTGTRENADFLAHFNFPETGLGRVSGTQFSFDYKNIHFVVLNSEYDYEEQAAWLREDLAATDKPWKVAVFHRGPYGSIYNTAVVRDAWAPVFDEFEVDLVLSGHDHLYMRTYPMKNNEEVEPGQGTVYVVGGSTGPKFYPPTKRGWEEVVFAEETQVFSSVEVKGGQLVLTAQTIDGRIIDQFTLTKPDWQPVQVEVIPNSAELAIGEQIQLEAVVHGGSSSDHDIIWTIENRDGEDIISLSDDGVVAAIAEGEAAVRATSIATGAYGESHIRVRSRGTPVELTAITLEGKEQLAVGAADQTVVTAVYSDGSRIHVNSGVSYTSSDPEVAEISVSGLVTAKSEGTVLITAEYEGLFASYGLTVSEKEAPVMLKEIEFTGPSKLIVGNSAQTVVTAVYSDGSRMQVNSGVSYASSDPEAAEISASGVVTAKAEATVLITAEYEGLAASFALSIVKKNDIEPEPKPEPEPEKGLLSLELSGLNPRMRVNSTAGLLVTAIYDDGSRETVSEGITYTSSQPRVASISGSGVVSAHRPGTTTITAAYEGKSASFTLRVHSAGGSSFTPLPTTPDPSTDKGNEVAGVLELTELQFRNHVNDSGALIEVSESFAELLLPWNAADWLEGKPLMIRSAQWELTIPAAELQRMMHELNPQEAEGRISLQLNVLEADKLNQVLEPIEQRIAAELTALSEGLQFRLAFQTSDGQEEVWTQFAEPLSLSMKINYSNRELASLYYIAEDGELVFIGGAWNSSGITSAIEHFSTYAVLSYDKKYDDVPSGYWAEPVIKQLSARQIVEGAGYRQFEPYREVTRAEFAAMLVRILQLKGEAPRVFHDVEDNRWYAGEVALAYQAGLINGVEEQLFAPEAPIKRHEMTAMIVRAHEYQTGRQTVFPSTEPPFTDVEELADWAKEAIGKAYELGLVNGRSERLFEPEGLANRAESAQLIFNWLTSSER
ncbi:phosphodiester glycosidase family protein [Paenibacillus senegalensis]|uniref:phosphodiester glycosidase family protein n=1 Tax=Paenibacillus senegalensis TaxID=1465766 RepID=UPI000288E733|nr:phosphodiester glycosidase family protein [Paenibacillus senegalensis]